MEHGQKADPGSQPFGIGSHFQQGLSRGTEQNAINYTRVLQR
jgi:hypothetical protein